MQAATGHLRGFGRAGESAGSRIRATMDRARAAAGRFGQRARRVGATLTKTLTAAISGVAAATTTMAASFQAEMSKIVGLVGVGRKRVNQWKDDILAMSGQVAKSPKELAKAMFFITSAGLRGEQALSALRASAKASAGGLGETQEVANAVTNALNAYEKGSISAKEATDVLSKTVEAAKANAAELAPQFGRVLPFASELGVSFDQLGGALAFFTKATGDASKAGTFLEGILRMLVKPTTQARDALQQVGTSFEGVQKSIAEQGLLPTLNDLRGRFDASDAAISDLFADSNALAGALQLTGSQADSARGVFDALADSSGKTKDTFEEASRTAAFQAKAAWSNLKATLIGIGRDALPAVTGALEDVNGALEDAKQWWAGLSNSTKEAIMKAGALVAALGPVLVILGALATVFSVVSVAALGWAAAVAGIVVAIGGLVAGLVWAWNNIETFRDVVTGVFDAVKAAISVAIDVAGAVIDAFIGWARDAWSRWGEDIRQITRRLSQIVSHNLGQLAAMGKTIIAGFTAVATTLWETFGETITKFTRRTWDNVKLIIGGFVDVILGTVNAFLAVLQGDWEGAWEGVKQVLEGAMQALTGILGQAMNTFGTIISAGVDTVATVWDGVRDAMARPVNWVIENVLNPFVGAIEKVADAVGMSLDLPSISPVSFGGGGSQLGGAAHPTMHTGGVVGRDEQSGRGSLGWDERLRVLKIGETVRTPGQEAALANANRAVGGPQAAGGDGASMIDALWSVFGNVPGTQMTSGYRPSSDTYHGRRMAIDVVGDWNALYRAAQGVWGQLVEAIGPGPRWRLDGQTFAADDARSRWPGLWQSHVASNRHWHFAATPSSWSGGGGGGVMDWVASQVANMAGDLVDPLRDQLSDWAGVSGWQGLLAGTVDSLIDGAMAAVKGESGSLQGMASGGRLAAGEAAVVGEQGPELAVGGPQGASVLDAQTTAGLGGVTIGEVSVHVEGRGPNESDEQFAQRVARAVRNPDVVDELDRGVATAKAAR
jgi:TP901 family phage tail tape measure protein